MTQPLDLSPLLSEEDDEKGGGGNPYVRHLLKCDEIAGLTYCTLHNLRFYQRLTEAIRREIRAGTFQAWAQWFLDAPFNDGEPPQLSA